MNWPSSVIAVLFYITIFGWILYEFFPGTFKNAFRLVVLAACTVGNLFYYTANTEMLATFLQSIGIEETVTASFSRDTSWWRGVVDGIYLLGCLVLIIMLAARYSAKEGKEKPKSAEKPKK